jgi:uncharacterized protein (TIGR04255 family)
LRICEQTISSPSCVVLGRPKFGVSKSRAHLLTTPSHTADEQEANAVNINLTEQFPHLPQAPIVEAVIEIRTRAEAPWEEGPITQALKQRLADYPDLRGQHAGMLKVTMRGTSTPEQQFEDQGWRGLHFKSADERHVVQCNRDSFVFSRLAPYQSWEQFSREGLRLWQVYLEVARPSQAQRIGLRFINRIEMAPDEMRYEDYIQPAPEPPKGMDLPFHHFVHHDVLAVPDHTYAINVIRTIQHPTDMNQGLAVILDIDAFTTVSMELTPGLLGKCLPEMRWLKNKVFFGSVTKKALETFQE